MATFPALGTVDRATRTALLQLNARLAALEGAPGGGVTDHGALTGLADDDHPHYALESALGDLALLDTVGSAQIDDGAVTNAKAADMATARIKGRVTGGTGDPEDLTGTQATTLLDAFTSGLKGLAPASGGGTSNFLRADGNWRAPTLYNANTSNGTASGADTYIVGSALAVGGRLKAGTILKWSLAMTKTNAGVATPVFNVRFGTAGTTADTAQLVWTGVAQTAATDTGFAEVTVVIRSVSATGVAAGYMTFEHFNTTTGFANKAQAQIFATGSAAFDNTSASLIAGLSINPGASAVWTFMVVAAEAINLA